MARRRIQGLQRVLGVNALFSTAYGNVGSSIYYALGLVASYALGLTPVVFIVTGFIFYLTASTYSEATTMFPEAGGSSSFARHAFNEFWSFFAAWAQMLNYTITIAISAFFVPHYIGGLFFPALRHGPGDVIFAIVLTAVLSAVNIVGVSEAAALNIVLAITDFCTQLLLVALGAFLVFSPHVLLSNIHLGVAPTWKNFLISIPIGMIAYTGIETISNMAEEARDESHTVPQAIKRVVWAVFAIYIAMPLVALSALPVHLVHGHYETLLGVGDAQGGFAGDPVLGIVKHLGLGTMEHAAEIYVGLLAATILLIATNAGIIGVSRLVYSMGLHRQMPDGLRRLHPRFRTPWIGIIVFGAIACVTIIPGQATFLGNMYAFGAMLSFTIAHLAVIRLRLKEPERARPYKGPWTLRVRGRELPLFAVLGAIGTGLAFVTVAAIYLDVAVVGLAWLAIGVIAYVVFRHHQGLDLTTTVTVVMPKTVIETEAEYESVLVAFDERGYVPEVMATASRMASLRRHGVHVLVTIPVPASAPIDAAMPRQEQDAESVIAAARTKIGRRATGHWEKVRPGQSGRRIVDQAREIKATAIVLPMTSGASGWGRTLETVLRERPCRVVIESIAAHA
jgi:APA family basic amino acid/polyamine antiporter